jgi:CBS domain containing-hemolysin-like protein
MPARWLALLRSRIGLQAQATEDYQTLAGLVMSLLDRLPVVGDEVQFAGWRMRVDEVHERRVNRLLLTPEPQ